MDELLPQWHLVDRVANAIDASARLGSIDPIIYAEGQLLAERISPDEFRLTWHAGFKEYRRRTCPNRRPWWRRIWSIRLLPTPDHRPGGPWR